MSRYGLIDYGNSLDKVGLLSSKASDLSKYLPVISGKDEKDPTSCSQPDLVIKNEKIGSIAIPKESMEGISEDVKVAFENSIEALKGMGMDIEIVNMPALKYAMPAYYVLATSEASTNLARYVGMRYGHQDGDLSLKFDDYFTYFRSKYFGDEAKRRILLGTYNRMAGFRDRYYAKALNVRMYVIDAYKQVFKEHDAILTPTMPFVSPRFDNISKMTPVESYQADYLTVPANLAGTPHLSVPCGYDRNGMPIGMQFVTDHWKEDLLLTMANTWDRAFEVRRRRCCYEDRIGDTCAATYKIEDVLLLSDDRCGCSQHHVCPTCLGMPGSKPMLNKKAIEYGIMLAKMLRCTIPDTTWFSRKTYFYPDMSKSVQITQYDNPIGYKGVYYLGDKPIRITRIHLEEDPGKTKRVGDLSSLIDYNRSGIPLAE